MTLDPSAQTLSLHIDRVNVFGLGVAQKDKQTYHVPFVLAGEEVEVMPRGKKRDVVTCELVRVIAPSPKRALPPCEIFGLCGGCELQHVSYDEQLSLKASWVKEMFVKFPHAEIASIVASPNEYFYRNRITLHRDGNQIGFHKRFSHDVVPVKKCWIASEALNEKIKNLSLPQEQECELREDDFKSSFVQVNSLQNENLIRTVASLATAKKSARLLELYAGQGNLTFALSEIAKTVLAIEGEKAAVAQAEARRIALQNKSISFQCAPVYDALFSLAEAYEVFDTVVCDPPREGLRDATFVLPRLKPQRIVYVSCEPYALVRDAVTLESKSYKLKKIVPLDMFPQTHHVEVVALFEKV
jgi:23S rRNA (uracil1939-C5)-methyltransferase